MKECYIYKTLPPDKTQCQACSHYCLIENKKTGKCGVRKNINGKLYSLVYEKPCALNIDPIEKKPLFHFLPGTKTLSIATIGCNFTCWACQNYQISQAMGGSDLPQFREGLTLPEEVVETALQNHCPSLSFTYTEPTVFLEYALDTMKLAKENGLKNIWVTNGFLSKETSELILPYLDAVNVDLKGFDDEFYKKYCGGQLKPVLDTLKRIKKNNTWLEITTLVIPGFNDSEETFKNIADFIKKDLGKETPWHISRFCGSISWKLQEIPDTPLKTIKNAWQLGKKAGLKYVYTGNAPGLNSEDTFCSQCNSKMIERTGYLITRFDKNGSCARCGEGLNLIS